MPIAGVSLESGSRSGECSVRYFVLSVVSKRMLGYANHLGLSSRLVRREGRSVISCKGLLTATFNLDRMPDTRR